MKVQIGKFGGKIEVTVLYPGKYGWTYAGDVWGDYVKVLEWVDGYWVQIYRNDDFAAGMFVKEVDYADEVQVEDIEGGKLVVMKES